MAQRGTYLDTGNRFIRERHEEFDDGWQTDEPEPELRTEFADDSSRSAFARNDSPDIPFTHSVNPYRGCEHGCAYCYARPTHEYLGFNAGVDFESKIIVKRNAPALVREAMAKRSWQPTAVSISGVTDPYQPVERKLRITRGVLEVMRDFRNPVAVVTKNALVTRDLDLLQELARYDCAAVFISVTTLDRDLARKMEPRTSAPERRLDAVRQLAEAGVPVGVMVAPIIPGLTDPEIPAILKAAAGAGAHFAHYTILRLPLAVRPIFLEWLERLEPARSARVRHALEQMRGGALNLSTFGDRMGGRGPRAEAIARLFRITARSLNLNSREFSLSTRHFRKPGPEGQTRLFD